MSEPARTTDFIQEVPAHAVKVLPKSLFDTAKQAEVIIKRGTKNYNSV
jgi:hypothetical protein